MDLEALLEDRDLVVIDLETTGTDVRTDRIVQLGAVKIFADGVTPRKEVEVLVNPQMPIPAEASEVHGITDDMVRDKPPFGFFAKRWREFLENCDLAGYNILGFDLPLLRNELQRCGYPLDESGRRIIDVMVIYKLFERRGLADAVRFYCGREHVDAHSALADVLATIDVAQAQLDRYAGTIPADVAGLAKLPYGDHKVTADGKIIWKDDKACLSFGQHSGIPLEALVRQHGDYLEWILGKDFSPEVKQVISRALKGRFPVKG